MNDVVKCPLCGRPSDYAESLKKMEWMVLQDSLLKLAVEEAQQGVWEIMSLYCGNDVCSFWNVDCDNTVMGDCPVYKKFLMKGARDERR